LALCKDATFKIVIGHHPVGNPSGLLYNLPKIEEIFDKHNFQA